MDVQSSESNILLGINRVGCKGIKKHIERDGIMLYVTINAYVELNAKRKGIHMSRIIDAIDEIIEKMDKKVRNCEDFCVDIAKEIVALQGSGEQSYIELSADFTTQRKKFDKVVDKVYELFASSTVTKKNIRKAIGCSALGINACPCAQEEIKKNTIKKLKNFYSDEDIEKIISIIPLATHNQRVKITLIVETDENEHVELEDLIDICENSFSNEIFEMLKRPEEEYVVESAHRNPLFVEDSIRLVMKNFYEKYKNLKTAKITAKVESFESIHPHNAIAESEITIDELRKIFEK